MCVICCKTEITEYWWKPSSMWHGSLLLPMSALSTNERYFTYCSRLHLHYFCKSSASQVNTCFFVSILLWNVPLFDGVQSACYLPCKMSWMMLFLKIQVGSSHVNSYLYNVVVCKYPAGIAVFLRCCLWSLVYHHHHNRLPALFLGPPGWDGARRKILLDFIVLVRITRGRHIDNLGGRHSVRTNQQSTSIRPPIFMPDARPTATLPIYSGLRQAQEYAGFIPPWLGFWFTV